MEAHGTSRASSAVSEWPYRDRQLLEREELTLVARELPWLSALLVLDEDDDDDDDDDDRKKPAKKPVDEPTSTVRRKTTILSLLCTNDPLAAQMAISFVGTPDSCTYIFEARSPAACAGIETATQQLGPGGVFGVIALIAVLVYLVGGCVYQRTVMH